MEEKDPILPNGEPEKKQPEIITNDYDPAVVIEEADRTVLLTQDETVIIEKDPLIETVPKNRPRKVYGGMWGPMELATVGGAMLALLALILAYLFVVVPSNNEVERTRAQTDKLDKDLTSAKAKYGDITNSKEHAAKLVSSVDDFQARFLPVPATGGTAVAKRINGLLASYSLTNTSGPMYSPLDLDDGRKSESDGQGKEKFKSLFPGMYITMTVEGSYQNLRRFIREIETTQQFVVISTISIEPSDSEKKEKQALAQQQQGMQPGGIPGDPNSFGGMPMQPMQPAAPAGPKGKMHGEIVALRLEMAAYYRRADFAPALETIEQ